MGEFNRRYGYFSQLIFCLASLYVLLLSGAVNAHAVGGISSSKVFTPTADTVPKKHFEFDPFFQFEFVDDNDNTFRFGGGVRITLGILQNLETGVDIRYLNHENSDLTDSVNNFGDIEAGIKFRFLDQGDNYPFSLAYQGGVSFPTSGEDAPWFIEPGGLILSKYFNEQFSLDTDFVFGIVEDDGWSFISNVGFGYYLVPWFQAVIEVAYAYEDIEGEASKQVVNITPGFTSSLTDWVEITIGVTPDIYTDNTEKEIAITTAFTFSF